MDHRRVEMQIRTILGTWRDAVHESRLSAREAMLMTSIRALRLLDELDDAARSSESLSRRLEEARAEVQRAIATDFSDWHHAPT